MHPHFSNALQKFKLFEEKELELLVFIDYCQSLSRNGLDSGLEIKKQSHYLQHSNTSCWNKFKILNKGVDQFLCEIPAVS